jgi:predicted 3-demethylubiquinone-9 3-methyltransferase (glyoxalase superfamily)
MEMIKQKIVPHLWFDKVAREAAEFYCSVFPGSGITNVTTLHDTPSGDTDIVSFEIMGYMFQAISAGPLFKFNPSVSFMINFDPSQVTDARKQIDEVWEKLIDGGSVLMPIDEYPFSERYGWVQDKYGLSWQLIYTNPEGEERPPVLPSLLFVGDNYGKAKEATDFYISIFKNAARGAIARYPADMEPDEEGMIMFTDYKLEGQWFAAMDSAREHDFGFNEAISFMVFCKDQQEIDHYWGRLSAVPEAEQCGWLKDRYGFSWQIVPAAMDRMLQDQDRARRARVTMAFLQMKKFDIAELERAYQGKQPV